MSDLRRAVGVVTTGCVALVSAALLATPASAASSAALSFAPAKGLATTPMYMFVPGPCPAQATNVVAYADGHGFPSGGQIVVNNSTAGISHTDPFVLPLQDTFVGFAADNGATLAGPYRVTVQCTDRLQRTVYATFSSAVTFSDGNHYTAPAPSPALVKQIEAAQAPKDNAPAASTAPGATGSGSVATGSSAPSVTGSSAPSGAGGSNATGSAGAVPVPQTSAQSAGAKPGATSADVSSADKASTDKSSSSTWQPLLVVAAALLIALAVLLRISEVRRGRRRDEAKEAGAAAASLRLPSHTIQLPRDRSSENNAESLTPSGRSENAKSHRG